MNTTSTRSAYSHAAAVGLAFVVALTVSALLTPTPSAASGAWIDTFDRQAVIAHHDAAFSGAVPDHGWTGDLSTCSAGTTSPEYRSAIIDRVNWYRAMAGLGPITEDVERSADAQEAAVMNSVQPQGSTLSHDRAVTANFACSTPAASEAAAHSNLARGVSGPTAINSYIRDRGESNTSVGHRNWILSASAEQFGVGDMPKVGDNRATNVLWVDEESDRNPAGTRDGFIAWPNPGFVPNTSVYPRWSFALPRPAEGLDVTEAEVTMQRIDTGRFIDAPIIYRGHNGGAPVDVIVWEPTLDFTGDAGSLPRPALDTTYRITISNIVTQAGATVSYSFDTTVIGDETAIDGPKAAVRTEVAAAAPEPAPAPAPMDPNHAFTHAAHQDFLGRAATAAELTAWSNSIDQGDELEASRYALVTELSLRDEWTEQIIEIMYQDTFGRSADAEGRRFWIDQLRSGRTVASVAANFYSSPEYLARHGDNITLWVEDLYVQLLDRPAEGDGLTWWVEQVDLAGEGAVAFELYQSDESARARVQALYAKLLDRSPDAGGQAFWAEQLRGTGNDLGLAAELASSGEYFTRAAAAR